MSSARGHLRRLLPVVLVLAGGSGAAWSAPRSAHPSKAKVPSTPVPTAGSAADAGVDLVAQARRMYRVAACGGTDPVPTGSDATVVDAHCQALGRIIADYRARYLDQATAFLATVVPAGIPTTVVYPFGGGDLVTALATFPAATELTTISLEPAGDVRAIDTLGKGMLARTLRVNRTNIDRLFGAAYSRTVDLRALKHQALPGELLFELVALAIHHYQPTSLRYFHLDPDGSVRYVTAAELAAKRVPRSTFDDVELVLRPEGGGPTKVFRHIAFDLGDGAMKANPALLRYLEARGTVTAMTKASSYLLSRHDFSRIRDYLLGHMAWMISDSTGIQPEVAGPAGFEQVPYGTYAGAFLLDARGARDLGFQQLWQDSPHRDLGFRFGYQDRRDHPHLVITRRRPAP